MLIQPSPTHSAKRVEESIPLRDLELDNDFPVKATFWSPVIISALSSVSEGLDACRGFLRTLLIVGLYPVSMAKTADGMRGFPTAFLLG